jgi:hypothetical protein
MGSLTVQVINTSSMPWKRIFFPMAGQPLGGLGLVILRRFTITLRHTTLGRTPLDEGPSRRRDLYLTTHNTHKRQTFMPPVGFEPMILVSERPQTHALDRAATGIGAMKTYRGAKLYFHAFLTFGSWMVSFTSWSIYPCTYWVAGWLAPEAVWIMMKGRQSVSSPGIETQILQ